MKKEETERYNKAKELRKLYSWNKAEERDICIQLEKVISDYEAAILEESRKIPLTTEQKIAILLHQHQCHWNHTDQCAWYYEIEKDVHDWSRYEHVDYLRKANKMIERLKKYNFSYEQFEEIIKAIYEK